MARVLGTVRDLTILQPTDAQRAARATFWASVRESATQIPPGQELSIALRLAGNPAIREWWGQPGFQDWFLNRDSFKQRMDLLAEMSADALQEIIQSKQASASDKLKAIGIIMSVSDKIPRKTSDAPQMLDEKVAQMNAAQLAEFIARSLPRPVDPPTVDVTPTKE